MIAAIGLRELLVVAFLIHRCSEVLEWQSVVRGLSVLPASSTTTTC
jgi:hypothetical protein